MKNHQVSDALEAVAYLNGILSPVLAVINLFRGGGFGRSLGMALTGLMASLLMFILCNISNDLKAIREQTKK